VHSVLILGCGNIAGGFDTERESAAPLTHAGGYRAHGGFHIAACVDPDDARREAFAARWNVDRAAASIAALGSAAPGAFDVISICSPNACHAEHLDAAIALRPRLIFCEKPVTDSAAETEAAVQRCAEAGVALAVNYSRRWAPDTIALAEELAAGEWGAVRSVVGTYTKGVVHNGGHMIDLIHLLLGPVRLIAAGQAVHDFWDDDPSVPALLETESGVAVHLAIGDARDCALFELTIITERGEIAMRDGGFAWSERRVGDSAIFPGYRTLGQPTIRVGEYERAMRAAIDNIAAALDHGAALRSTGETALAAQRVCEAIRTAARAADPLSARTKQ